MLSQENKYRLDITNTFLQSTFIICFVMAFYYFTLSKAIEQFYYMVDKLTLISCCIYLFIYFYFIFSIYFYNKKIY